MVVTDDQLHAAQAALAQTGEEVAPGGIALARSGLDAEHAAVTLVVDADRDQDGLGADHAALAHALVASIADEVGIGLLEAARGELREALIEGGVDAADRRGREGVAAELLGDRLHLARRDALHVHLRERSDEGFLAARVALEELRRETALTVAGHAQLELADPGHEAALVEMYVQIGRAHV